MKYLQQAAVIIFILVFGGLTATTAQSLFRASDQEVAQLLARIDTHAESYRKSLAIGIDQSFLKTAEIGKYLKDYAWDFELLADRLKERSRDRKPISSDVQELLNRGPYLNTFMSVYDFGAQAERDWKLLVADLNQLADYYKLKTYWGMPTEIGSPPRPDLSPMANRLIGTYKLDKAQSEEVRKAVERAANDLPPTVRRRVMSGLLARMRTPELLAIDRQGEQVTLASSLRPARVYAVTGRAQTERGPLESVLLYGGQFRINTLGDTESIYSVTYAVDEQGTQLRVTHAALLTQFSRPLIIVSYYKKVSDIPQLNLATEEPDSATLGLDGAGKKNQR